MTKVVRIENADTSTHKVRVYREIKNEAGEWVRNGLGWPQDHDRRLARLG